MASLVSRLAGLNPFGETQKVSKAEDNEDIGEAIDADTKAGGGHAGRESGITRHQLRVSYALRAFLLDQQVISPQAAALDNPEQLTGELRELVEEPHVRVPPELTTRSHPLPDYFISSSHNTYLTAHQLYGDASAQAYKTVLQAGSRCVEIDAWDSNDPNEPKVTHGYTLTSNTSFRSVCETIRDVVDQEAAEAINEQGYRAAPILISLENHCGPQGQQRLVDIMKEVFAHRLLSKAVRDKGSEEQRGTGEHVRLEELGNKIAVIVEYHFPGEPDSSDAESSSDEDEQTHQAHLEYEKKKQETASLLIIPELAELGIYAQSVKPPNNKWFEEGVLDDSPHHPLINVSETGLGAHLPLHSKDVASHNSNHLMRVYPKGTRISSRNLKPVPYWGVGAQICALNWQTFGASVQLNEALFTGTDGYVLKPEALRNTSSNFGLQSSRMKRLRVHIAGATDVTIPDGREVDDIKPYVTCSLVHPDDLENNPPKKKTSPYKPHKLQILRRDRDDSPANDPVWDEVLEWDYLDNDLVFLRLLIKSDDAFARNPIFAVSAVRLLYVQSHQWRFIRMLDLSGHETTCSLLVRFDILDV